MKLVFSSILLCGVATFLFSCNQESKDSSAEQKAYNERQIEFIDTIVVGDEGEIGEIPNILEINKEKAEN